MDKLPEAVLLGTASGKVRQNGPVLENCIAAKQQKTENLRGGDRMTPLFLSFVRLKKLRVQRCLFDYSTTSKDR